MKYTVFLNDRKYHFNDLIEAAGFGVYWNCKSLKVNDDPLI